MFLNCFLSCSRAPNIICVRERSLIDTSGYHGTTTYNCCKADGGWEEGRSGEDGKDGNAGEAAGHVYIRADKFIKNFDCLEVNANGGNGSNGQDGGDGRNGRDGTDGRDGSASASETEYYVVQTGTPGTSGRKYFVKLEYALTVG